MEGIELHWNRFEDLKTLTTEHLKSFEQVGALFNLRYEAEMEYAKKLSLIGTHQYMGLKDGKLGEAI